MKLHTFIPGILNTAYIMHESSGGLMTLTWCGLLCPLTNDASGWTMWGFGSHGKAS